MPKKSNACAYARTAAWANTAIQQSLKSLRTKMECSLLLSGRNSSAQLGTPPARP